MRVTQKSRRLKALIGATTAAVAALPVFVGAGVASASTPGATDAANVQGFGPRERWHQARVGHVDRLQQAPPGGPLRVDERDIPLDVIRPADTSKAAPTLYLLNGAGGGEDSASWQKQADIGTFFQGKQVNVVTPMQGAFTYYTDWQKADDALHGVNKWEPCPDAGTAAVIDSALGTTKVNSLAGISTSGTSVFNLALKDPQLYKAVGCLQRLRGHRDSDGPDLHPDRHRGRGSAEVENMWGPVGSPDWQAHDPIYNIGKLKGGPKLYVANASGLPGPHDTLESQGINGNVSTLANQIIVGGIIEAATNECPTVCSTPSTSTAWATRRTSTSSRPAPTRGATGVTT
ncbi:esterase family protein [Rhodococcus hoagii]|nr:esterase family protein [Prescottella equi]